MESIAWLAVIALSSSLSIEALINPQDFKGDFNKFLNLKPSGASNLSSYDGLTTPEIIQSFGYKAETHYVVTEDGYILAVHRIPYGISGPTEGPRPVAFLQHCLLCSSSDWIMNTPDKALAYLLADAGYDVWMNNVRGNTYSRNHTLLDPDKKKKKFWEFTWDQMSYYDVPAAIDYALAVTGQTDVYYVGFSMGTTNLFALMSERQEYRQKIKVAALMGPVAYVKNIKGPMRLLGDFSGLIDFYFGLIRHYEILPSGPMMDYLAQNNCAEGDLLAETCYNILFLIGGYDEPQLNKEYLPAILSHTPAGTSVHTIDHFGQLIKNGRFQKYDWGRKGNKDHYGQKTPPEYNLGVDMPPTALFSGANDWLADPQDVKHLASELKNVVLNQIVGTDKWSHLDFIWGLDAKKYVYDHVLNFLAQY